MMGSKRQDLYMPIINVTIILVAEGKVNGMMECEVGKIFLKRNIKVH